MDTKQITITVAGQNKSGKSSLAYAITKHLRKAYSLRVKLTDDNGIGVIDQDEQTMWGTCETRTKKLASYDTVITIQTKLLKR